MCEVVAFLTSIVLLVKCLARLNYEIGTLNDTAPSHPMFWAALAISGIWVLIEISYVDQMEVLAAKIGRYRRELVRTQQTTLVEPLLPSSQTHEQDLEALATETVRFQNIISDIGGDPGYTAQWKDLSLVMSPDLPWIVCAMVFLILSAVANVYVPRFTGEILDALVAHASSSDKPDSEHSGSIVKIPGFVSNIEMLVIVSVLGGVFSGIRGAIFTVVGARVNVRLRLRLMDSLLSQDISFFEMTRTGDLTSRLSSDTTLVGSQVTSSVNIFLRSIVRAIGVLIFMFLISWQLSLLAFLTVPAVSVLSKWYGKYLRRLSKLQQKKLAEGNAISESAISSMATVRAFGAEAVELHDFELSMNNYLTLNSKTATATLLYASCVQALPELMKALVLFYGGLLVQTDGANHISGGQLVSFILYLTSLGEAFNSLGGIFASLTRAVGAADKVFELMHREPRLVRPSKDRNDADVCDEHRGGMLGVIPEQTTEFRKLGLQPDTCEGSIEFRKVCMQYPARPQQSVLDDMTFSIPAGSVVAFVGSSGSGKSSIISLIQHLYDITSGEVLLDGIPVHEFCPDWLCRHVSVVSQEPTLFARSIRRNIIYGLDGTEDEPSTDEIVRAAEIANAASFIERLPQGYDTNIGERGVQLSGGQKQRLAIARALVRKPKILLLDEATSALDAESEACVQEAIDRMIRDASRSMTVIIVAHRLSTVQNADTIFVVNDGKVIEKGSHSELLQNLGGAYYSLVSRQIAAQDKTSK